MCKLFTPGLIKKYREVSGITDDNIFGEIADIGKYDLIEENGIVICEDDSKEPYEAEGLRLRRFAKYGRIYVTVLEKTVSEDE